MPQEFYDDGTASRTVIDLRPYIYGLSEPGGRTYGAWTDYHVDKSDFAAAAAYEMRRSVDQRDVQHGYFRILRGVMHFTQAKGRGARAATWVEW